MVDERSRSAVEDPGRPGRPLLTALLALGFVAAAAAAGYGAAFQISRSAAAPTPRITLAPSGASPLPSTSPGASVTATPPLSPSAGSSRTPRPSAAPTGASSTPSGPGASPTIHVVAAGETLSAIARRYGVTVDQIVAANDLSDPNRVLIGQRLIIPTP